MCWLEGTFKLSKGTLPLGMLANVSLSCSFFYSQPPLVLSSITLALCQEIVEDVRKRFQNSSLQLLSQLNPESCVNESLFI